MTPTPRTDEALRNRPRYGIIEPAFVHADLARQLERENDILRKALVAIRDCAGASIQSKIGGFSFNAKWCAERAGAALDSLNPKLTDPKDSV